MNFPEKEQEIFQYWEKNRIFEKSTKKPSSGGRFVFFEGPPTANGRPGIHHVLVRSIKDAFLRYKTMRGFLVERKAGWDTHGLPVEIAVEKELGIRSKQDIENYGIAQFNEKAKESVWRHKDEWERLTARTAFWLDLKNPYITYHNSYIESVWWIMKEIWNKKLLQKDFKVVPFCTRCGTALASHEVAQGYESVKENSVYLKFRLKEGQKIGENFITDKNTYILSWTTTPWTLPGNVALAVGEDIDYYIADVEATEFSNLKKGETIIFSKNIKEGTLFDCPVIFGSDGRANVFNEEAGVKKWSKLIIRQIKGKELVGLEYEPLFDIPETQNDKSHKVYAANFVTTEDGTGVVHTAVMYGEDDYNLGNKIGLPKVHTVGEDGRFLPFVLNGLAGLAVKRKDDKTTEEVIIAYLKQHNFFFKEELYTHDYPFCWRCKTPLLYYARKSWFIRMSHLRKELKEANNTVNWIPEHIKQGRFGEWLKEVKDWAISRERYWGTPLPVWECEECKSVETMGSIKELLSRSRTKNKYIVVRHAEATANAEGWISSWPESRKNHLTERGIKQAQIAGKRIAKLKPDLIIASPLERTMQTARIIGEQAGIEPQAEKDLREFDLGAFNTRPIKEYHDFLDNDHTNRWNKRPLNGENWEDLRKRMYMLFQKLEQKYSDKTIVLVSHGDPILLFKGITMGIEDKDFLEPYIKTKASEIRLSYPAYAREEILPMSKAPLDESGRLDLHRPYVDALELECAHCDGKMKRVPEVMDVWLDSGTMPFSQWHYPFENKEKVDARGSKKPEFFPADFIVEAIDQTRGWFYTLMAISVLLDRGAPYKNVMVTGHVVDKNGKKMSKSLGNIVDPWEMIDKYGSDAVRWYFFTMNNPADTKRFSEQELKEVQQKFLGTLWNSFSFFELYAPPKTKIPDSVSSSIRQAQDKDNILDKWILSRLATVNEEVQKKMDVYEITAATRAISAFVTDDLSNWYIRRSRDRFQHPSSKEDLKLASELLGFVLKQTALLSASFIPFVAESIWLGLGEKSSVHLAELSKIDKKSQKPELEQAMEALRFKIQIALKLRAQSGQKVRQPLGKLVFDAKTADKDKLDKKLFLLLQEELNIEKVEIVAALPKDPAWVSDEQAGIAIDTTITPALYINGLMRELIRQVQVTRKDAGMKPKEYVLLRLSAQGRSGEDIMKRAEEIKKDVYAKKIETGEKRAGEDFIVEREFDLGESRVWMGLRKIKN